MNKAILGAVLALTGGLSAQITLPKGFQTTEGNDVYHTGWDIRTSINYYPARDMEFYDVSTFPWNTSTSFVITKLSVRRDAGFLSGSTTAHTKEMTIIMSTSKTLPVANPNWNHYDNNHGADRTVVMGKIGKGKTITFPATPAPATGKTAPFNVVMNLDTPFVVKPGTKTLIVEFRFYKTSVTTGRFRVDAESYSGTGYNGGAYTGLNSNHCVTPNIYFTSRAITIGSSFGQIWRTEKSPGGMPWVGIAGTKLASAITVPNTNNCQWWVNPILVISGLTEKSGEYALFMDFGVVPRDASLVGKKIAHQALVLDPAYAQSLGFTRGSESTIGTGYDPKLVFGSQIYSYGDGSTNARYITTTDPDNEPHARYLFRRTPILLIN